MLSAQVWLRYNKFVIGKLGHPNNTKKHFYYQNTTSLVRDSVSTVYTGVFLQKAVPFQASKAYFISNGMS